jgi:hypothetical protein
MVGVPLLILKRGETTAMAFTQTNPKGVTYYLNSKEVVLRGGKKQVIFYFSKDLRPETAVEKLPDGMEVNVNPRNGFMTVKRSK